MNVLQLVAHPDLTEKSFTWQLAHAFEAGVKEAGHTFSKVRVFDDYDREELKSKILEADHLNLVWPCWWELPPARLVDLLQTIFVQGFAFDFDGTKMVPKLSLPTSCFISMGQRKEHHTDHLTEAFGYCGLKPTFRIFQNVGPRLSAEHAEIYLELVRKDGRQL